MKIESAISLECGGPGSGRKPVDANAHKVLVRNGFKYIGNKREGAGIDETEHSTYRGGTGDASQLKDYLQKLKTTKKYKG